MTVILKDIPGVTVRELLDTLHDIRSDRPVQTGHGGFVVDEETALEFLQAYLVVTGKREPLAAPESEPEPEPVADSGQPTADGRQTAKRRATKKGAGQ